MVAAVSKGSTLVSHPCASRPPLPAVAFVSCMGLLICCWGDTARAEPPAELSDVGERAYTTLLAADTFSDSAVGIAGITPDTVLAFRTLMKEAAADTAFKQLLSEAALPGQLYALCGIYFTDPMFFSKAVEPYRQSAKTIQTQFGCIGSEQTVKDLVDSSDPAVVRLSRRGQTTHDWVFANPDKTANGFTLDIIGGGYPNEFNELDGYHRVSGLQKP